MLLTSFKTRARRMRKPQMPWGVGVHASNAELLVPGRQMLPDGGRRLACDKKVAD
jgi:hypothetical protein